MARACGGESRGKWRWPRWFDFSSCRMCCAGCDCSRVGACASRIPFAFPSPAWGEGRARALFAVRSLFAFREQAQFLREDLPASLQVRPASLRAGNFSLLVQREVTKRKDTPSGPVSGLVPADCAIGLRGSLTVHPWTATNARASCARPFGRILHPLAGPRGDPGGRAARSCAQKQKPKHRGGSRDALDASLSRAYRS